MILNCKNCDSELAGNYCANCGVPATLHRINGHYILHEIEHVLHFEKGIPYTVKQLLIRPGQSVRYFLNENRNRLVKPILFIVVTSLIYTLINHYYHIEEQYISDTNLKNSSISTLLHWIQEHYGYANIIMGIFIAFSIKIFFRKPNYNSYEIVILLCYVMGMGMLILAFFALLQGMFKLDLVLVAVLVGIFYTTFAIADFYDRKLAMNYIKSFFAYILGTIVFYVAVIILGLTIDTLSG